MNGADRGLSPNDIQAMVAGFGKPWPHAQFIYLKIDAQHRSQARRFFAALPLTHAANLDTQKTDDGKPLRVCVNVAFTHQGLRALGINPVYLDTFPVAFRQGMRARAHLLGDVGRSAPEHWDTIWQNDEVDALLALYAKNAEDLNEFIQQLPLARAQRGVAVIDSQTAERIFYDPLSPVGIGELAREPRPGDIIEHFGFRDGVSNPPINGLNPQDSNPGAGKLTKQGWQSLALGEVLLDHIDEAGERSSEPRPRELSRNGTYLVYRKLAQSVEAFRQSMRKIADANGVDPDYVATKMMGRNRDGTPLGGAAYQGYEVSADVEVNNDIRFVDDPHGAKCPMGSHIRRANPRDSLGFGTLQVNRHRLLRRAITYSKPSANQQANPSAEDSHAGLLFLALNANLVRQFEFVQRQWINFGNDTNQGDLADPITGTTPTDEHSAFIIPPGKNDGYDIDKTVVCTNFANFVHNTGGDYFFLPGLRAYAALTQGDFG